MPLGTRTRAGRGLAGLATALAFVAVASGSLGAAALAQDATPAAGVLEGDPANLDCSQPQVNGTPSAPSATYQIVSASSEARYVAQEELAGRGANTAIGKTNAIVGQILFDANGVPMACSRFDVDLRTLTSDESRRDNYLYSNTLETEKNPLATFIVTSVTGVQGTIPENTDTPITLTGDLTVHGVTKPVVWTGTVNRQGDQLTGKATTNFQMADFDITPPKIGPVIGLDEKVELQIDITLKQA